MGSSVLTADDVAPGRLRAKLPEAEGTDVYTIVVTSPHGTQRMLHLRRSGAEDDSFGTSPAIDSWKQAGLVSEWNPASLSQLRNAAHGDRQPDRWLVGAGLALFLAGVVIDRTRVRFRWRLR